VLRPLLVVLSLVGLAARYAVLFPVVALFPVVVLFPVAVLFSLLPALDSGNPTLPPPLERAVKVMVCDVCDVVVSSLHQIPQAKSGMAVALNPPRADLFPSLCAHILSVDDSRSLFLLVWKLNVLIHGTECLQEVSGVYLHVARGRVPLCAASHVACWGHDPSHVVDILHRSLAQVHASDDGVLREPKRLLRNVHGVHVGGEQLYEQRPWYHLCAVVDQIAGPLAQLAGEHPAARRLNDHGVAERRVARVNRLLVLLLLLAILGLALVLLALLLLARRRFLLVQRPGPGAVGHGVFIVLAVLILRRFLAVLRLVLVFLVLLQHLAVVLVLVRLAVLTVRRRAWGARRWLPVLAL